MEIAEINVQRVDGSTCFTANTDKFIISPLSQATNIYIDGFTANTESTKLFGTTAANDYTTVGRVITGTRFHLDTDETFYVKWG